MNRSLLINMLALGLMVSGCIKQPDSLVNRAPVAAESPRKVDAKSVALSDAGGSALNSAQTSTSIDPKVAYYRDNFESLVASGALYQLELSPGALKDHEIRRLLFEKFKSEQRKGQFWAAGVSLLGETGDRSFAPLLWQEWANFPVYEPPATFSWGNIQHELSNPKSVLIRAVFRIGDVETITAVWQMFPAITEGDQLLIAKASSDILDPLAAADVIRIIDAARSERVRGELINSANRILYHVFTGGSETDRRWARETAIPLLSEMKKRGLMRDFLEKILSP